MATINIHAGDFKTGKHSSFSFGILSLARDEMGWSGYKIESISPRQISTLEVASETNVKRLAGTVGWGVAGAALLGPVGLLAGLIGGGRRKDVTFVCVLNDGRKILATTDSKTYTKIQAAIF